MKRLYARWLAFWYAPVQPGRLDLFRVTLLATLAYYLAARFTYVREWLSDIGFHPSELADRTQVGRILDALGQYLPLDETYFDALTAVGGSGPAFLFEFVAGLRDAGLAAGLPSDVAYRMALATTLGATRLLARSDEPPETLRDQVTSPNGTTFAGLQVMAARQFRESLKETVLAATRRAGELSRD